ncbi:hypothetical protein PDJ95_08820 [Bacillus cereus]|uniref:hypothetical protein n=1 Tax=Bacillus thuringiensis TaxID=1428 RepID=UPI001CD463F1|nr:hypothetical protein [Bacillus thuringiensis]MCA1000827.1 hypothetical protein [Bacillus thuringiensis]MDA1771491.1 hypothetical protein [Bacillus cereus]MED3321139.1 hypothetical protein [Bacillus thuringiensis]
MVEINIYTTENISSEIYAKIFFQLIQEIGIEFQKIALYEPINKEFSMEKAIEMWTIAEPGCYDFELDEMVGTAGGMLGKGKGISLMVNWWENPKEKTVNYLVIGFSNKVFLKYKDKIVVVFQKLVSEFNAIYGYISDEEIINRQHITGAIDNRIPGIFEYNHFGKLFVDCIGEDKLQSLSWSNSFPLNEGLLTVLDNKTEEEILLLEKQMKEKIGLNFFNGKSSDYPDVLKG